MIDVRHEQAAAMMANAYARLTGRADVCSTASGQQPPTCLRVWRMRSQTRRPSLLLRVRVRFTTVISKPFRKSIGSA
jgi:hypothetical protein